MNAEENWLTEIISRQKRIVLLSLTFLVLTAASISIGLSLYWYEPNLFRIFTAGPPPPVVAPDFTGLISVTLTAGILLLIGGVYLWEFYTPEGVQNQLHDLQELLSATIKSKRVRLKAGQA